MSTSTPIMPMWVPEPATVPDEGASAASENKKYYIWTIGCQMNVAESNQMAAAFQHAGLGAAATEAEADVIVLNSCVVRQASEDKVKGKIGSLYRLKRAKPELKIALTGCMATKHEDELMKQYPVLDLVFEPSAIDELGRIVPEMDDDLTALPHYYLPENTAPEVTAFVPIIMGCNKVCSYCIVPYRRGKERSRPIADLQAEVRELAARGVREVTLLGQIVDRYGYDFKDGTDLADLLEAIHDTPGLDRIRFLTSHPAYMSERIVRAVAEMPKVCEHINLPVQAGDDEVLRRMRRNYTANDYRRQIEGIRAIMPETTIATDIIVGFCGETDAQFESTLRLLDDVRCDVTHVAMYSPRKGTASARWEDDVPREVKLARHQAIERLQEGISQEHNDRLVGREMEVLVDGQGDGRWRGRTRGNKLVFFADDANRLGQMFHGRIARATPWFLQGDLTAIEGVSVATLAGVTT
ncbi:MAG: tRNA (N6-isopentenyl adenosine(37)-C2)-methylthiotransferase MiaB [Thermomicrobiales bacterium]